MADARHTTLKQTVIEQAPRYGEIKVPVAIISGDVDKTVSTNIHSRPFAAAVSGAKLLVLPGIGHMIQNAAPDFVVSEVEAMMGLAVAWAPTAMSRASDADRTSRARL